MSLSLAEFVTKWKASSLSERSSTQQRFCDLCEVLGQPGPADVDQAGGTFTFEKHVAKNLGGKGFADVWYRHHFAWEYKGKHKDLLAAYGQLRGQMGEGVPRMFRKDGAPEPTVVRVTTGNVVILNDKRSTIIFLAALVLLALVLALLITWPFAKPFAFAVILAVVFYPVHNWILRLTKQRVGLAALLSTLAVIVLFGVPAFIITTLAANEALSAAHYLSRRTVEEGGFTQFVMILASRPLALVGHWIDLSRYDLRAIVSANAQKLSLTMVGFGAAVLGNLARFTIDALITFVILFFFFREGKDWALRAGRITPLSEAQVAHLYRNISDTIIANVYGILTVGVVQGILTGIALKIVGLGSSLLLGLAAGFASIIPVVGSSIVWAPAAIYLLVTGSIWKGVFVLIWGALVISSVDNLLRPLVVAGRVELHPMVLLFFILGGVEAFGFLGLFLGPVVASVLAAVFRMLRDELRGAEPTRATGAG
jgi:predicted PurR-regulated permease PerM